jgi:hypothetical protein
MKAVGLAMAEAFHSLQEKRQKTATRTYSGCALHVPLQYSLRTLEAEVGIGPFSRRFTQVVRNRFPTHRSFGTLCNFLQA